MGNPHCPRTPTGMLATQKGRQRERSLFPKDMTSRYPRNNLLGKRRACVRPSLNSETPEAGLRSQERGRSGSALTGLDSYVINTQNLELPPTPGLGSRAEPRDHKQQPRERGRLVNPGTSSSAGGGEGAHRASREKGAGARGCNERPAPQRGVSGRPCAPSDWPGG